MLLPHLLEANELKFFSGYEHPTQSTETLILSLHQPFAISTVDPGFNIQREALSAHVGDQVHTT